MWERLSEPLTSEQIIAFWERLDGVVGVEGWSDNYTVVSVNPAVVLCSLEVNGVTKQDLGQGVSLREALEDAFIRAAAKFGLGRTSTRPKDAEKEAVEPQDLINKLVDKLKELGLGREVAQIITRFGGYGKTPEETRRLYGELRELLKAKT